MADYDRWRLLAPAGVATVGLGLSVLGHAIERKIAGRPWFVAGTVALSIVNTGIALVGEAVKARTLHELAQSAEVD